MNLLRVIIGFLVSIIGGAIILELLIELVIRKWYLKEPKPYRVLPIIVGILERALYTTALYINVPQWIPVWLALKTAAGFLQPKKDKYRQDYQTFLIGNAISLIFGVIGAWIALGKFPFNLPLNSS